MTIFGYSEVRALFHSEGTDYYKNYGEDKLVWHKLVLTMTFDIPAPL